MVRKALTGEGSRSGLSQEDAFRKAGGKRERESSTIIQARDNNAWFNQNDIDYGRRGEFGIKLAV